MISRDFGRQGLGLRATSAKRVSVAYQNLHPDFGEDIIAIRAGPVLFSQLRFLSAGFHRLCCGSVNRVPNRGAEGWRERQSPLGMLNDHVWFAPAFSKPSARQSSERRREPYALLRPVGVRGEKDKRNASPLSTDAFLPHRCGKILYMSEYLEGAGTDVAHQKPRKGRP